MAYTDLATLANDPTFLGRVAYAVMHYASYLQSAHTTIYQLTWANYAAGNPALVAQSIVQQVCQNGTVVSQLGAISDGDLQPVVETACNAIISAITPYAATAQLAADPVFLQRLQVAVVTFAEYIINESPTTANHSARYAWAKTALPQQHFIAQQVAWGVAQDGTIQTVLNTATDTQIQSAFETQANVLLLS